MNNIDFKKLALYGALFLVGFSLWGQWMNEQKKASPKAEQVAPVGDTDVTHVPKVAEITRLSQSAKTHSPAISGVPASRLIRVDTDLLSVELDRLGGRLVSVKLKKYPVSLSEKEKPTQLLSTAPGQFYVAESGLAGKAGAEWSDAKALYLSSQSHYVSRGNSPLKVDLSWRSKEGVLVKKQWQFHPGRYVMGLHYVVENQSNTRWDGHFYAQIRHQKPDKASKKFMRFNTYTGAGLFTPDKPYTKLSYKKMERDNFNRLIKGGWVAWQTHYFLSAWIPNQNHQNHYFSHVDNGSIYTVGFLGPAVNLPVGHSYSVDSQFYVGPEQVKRLKPLAKGLELTVDYGWLWPVSMLIMWGMRHIHDIVGNWGWSIILITLLIKLIFFKFSETSYRSMAKMRNLQPKLERIKKIHGEDKQALSRATMELYKQEKVNPLGGCLPFLVQIPVFIALYYVLIESIELRQAPFMFWIKDLSVKDPYFILPILMGISMLVQQKMTPSPSDPTQAKVMLFLPVIFTALFLNFPAGLVLYWFVNNCSSVLQQWYINWRFTPAKS